jgi:hypothetical protein
VDDALSSASSTKEASIAEAPKKKEGAGGMPGGGMGGMDF